jgi:hypothetical protein
MTVLSGRMLSSGMLHHVALVRSHPRTYRKMAFFIVTTMKN